jgi:hypothetical protein
MDGGLFLTVKDLMPLCGINYEAARKEHAYIRLSLDKNKKTTTGKRTKRKLTIGEYCRYMSLDFAEVWRFLRGDEPHPDVPPKQNE